MSGRLLKKVLKEHEESKLQNHHDEEEEEEDEDEEQLGGSRGRSSINPFDLLNDGDEDPESEKEAEIDDDEKKKKDEEADTVQPPSSKNKSKKKKKKKTKESRSNVVVKPEITLDETLEALSLGANSKQEEEVQETKPASSRPVLEIDPKYLNLENELRRMYGSKVVRSLESSSQSGGGGGGSSRQGRGGRRGVHHITKTVLITPMENWARWDRSFSMEFLETKDGYNYFRYTHSSSYEQAQRAFQAAQNLHDLNGVASVLINHPYHIDSLITMADYFKFAGDHQMSADAIGKCLYGLERAWHPMFTPFNGTSRLKYSHDANKPFFTALFAHMRNMDRRGCHRSALEVCKLLLSLDTDNPVGALFCVDYFALRAEEYAWLEEFSEEYQSENSLWLFPNFSYSLAIARVYLEKTEEASLDSSKSSSLDLMMQALKLHPTVLKKLVDKVPLKDQAWGKMLKHYYFRSDQSKNPSLDHLISIYVERNYLIWRLTDVQKLLKSAAELVIKQLDEKESDAEDFLSVKEEAFPAKHNEYSHLSIHDFSDSVPTLPPDNLQNFVADPRMGGGEQVAAGGGGGGHHQQQQAPPVRDVANRNPLAVFLESMLPWLIHGRFCVVMDRIASVTFSCPAFSTPRVCRIKPFGLNINTDHRKRFSCRVNTTAAKVVDSELDLEYKKHDLLRAVQETQRGLTATSDQRSVIEEALVTVEGFNGGEAIDLMKLDGTWRLQYTSTPDVVVLFEAASRFPFFQVVGQIFQKFECRDRSDGGIVRNVVQWSVPSLLEEQEGATLVVTAKFDKVSSRNIYLQFEEISVRNININEQVQALLAPAILPRSFLNLQILQFIRTFNAQIPVTATSPGRRSVGGLYYLSYLDNNMLLGRSVGGGGVFVFTKSQPLEL
ncbi:unnamed protein product [Brassica oleracea var. botrytis]